MSRPPAGGRRSHPGGGTEIYRSQSSLDHRPTSQSVGGYREHRRTAALGGHRDRCARCGYRAISYNSCRNRHCPKCQAQARDQWLEARRRELLPTPYVHVVFTLPWVQSCPCKTRKSPTISCSVYTKIIVLIRLQKFAIN